MILKYKPWLITATKRSIHHSIIGFLVANKFQTKDYLFDDSVSHKIEKEYFDYQANNDAICIAPYTYENNDKINDLLWQNRKKQIIFNIEGVKESNLDLNGFLMPENDLAKEWSCRKFLILRDCYNTLASAYFLGDLLYQLEDIKNAWKSQAKVALSNINSHLKHVFNPYFINANKWSQNYNYRQQICKDLNFPEPFQDLCSKRIANNAGGSIKSGKWFDGQPQKLDIMTRYKDAWRITKYREVIQDKELIELNEEIFGWSL